MRNLAFSLVLFLTGVQQIASAEVCSPEEVIDPRVAGRARQIRFPDGRLLTVVGHQHGLRQVLGLGQAKEKITAMSNVEFEGVIRKVLADSTSSQVPEVDWGKVVVGIAGKFGLSPLEATQIRTPQRDGNWQAASVLIHAQRDEAYLLAKLRSTADRPQFIGLEAFPPGIQDEMRESYQFVKSEIARRRGQLTLSEREINDFLLSGSMGQVHAYLENPALRNVAPLVNLEGPAAVPVQRENEGEAKAIEELFRTNQNYLQSLPPERLESAKLELRDYAAAFSEVIYQLENRLIGGENADQLADRLRRATPHWLNKPGSELVAIMHRFGLSVQARDEQAARNMVNLKRTGIYFVGALHLGPLTHNLVAMCRAEAAAAPGAPPQNLAPQSQIR